MELRKQTLSGAHVHETRFYGALWCINVDDFSLPIDNYTTDFYMCSNHFVAFARPLEGFRSERFLLVYTLLDARRCSTTFTCLHPLWSCLIRAQIVILSTGAARIECIALTVYFLRLLYHIHFSTIFDFCSSKYNDESSPNACANIAIPAFR